MNFNRLAPNDALTLVQNPDFLSLGRAANECSKSINGKRVAYTLRADFVTSTTTAVFSTDRTESWGQRLEKLLYLRNEQDEKKNLQSVLIELTPNITSHEYLRLVAIARLFLDNIPHIQTAQFSEEYKAGQLALSFGSDDLGLVINQASAIAAIVETGHEPYHRDANYNEITPEQTRELKNAALNKLRYGT